MYADDTAILVSGNSLELIQSEMTHELKQIERWFLDNKLALNLQKTKYIVFSSPSKDISAGVSDIKIGNKHIQRVESIKYLGVILDSCFNWKLHIDELCKKLGYSIYTLVKTRQYFDSKTLKLIYFSIFHTHLQYCVESWGFTYQSYIQPIMTLQKWAIRILANAKYSTHSAPLFQSQLILPFHLVRDYKAVVMMHHILTTNTPLPSSIFSQSERVTRNVFANNFNIPLSHNVFGQRMIQYTGTKIWNSLCIPIKESKTFKSTLKTFYLETMFHWLIYLYGTCMGAR